MGDAAVGTDFGTTSNSLSSRASRIVAQRGSEVIFYSAEHRPLACNPLGERWWLPDIRSYHNQFCFQRVAKLVSHGIL
ncbi:hypothetical protein SBA5_30187 [Candidatus Sulfotelmatomonas gaucii]|uniref:Uncharacterized protein n=1 Tax=Candidatus Sulfuritelmatomonas gaucii TaxID=2043161 RepID=A0A2N9LCH8_9BACT|nr:hypothetical protein SBA5_30187 [Candidatus Sulfotelmatomonas gaucii]